jgi:hypothetical protein
LEASVGSEYMLVALVGAWYWIYSQRAAEHVAGPDLAPNIGSSATGDPTSPATTATLTKGIGTTAC